MASKSSGSRCSDFWPLKMKKPFAVFIISPRSRVESENACSDARRACSSTVGHNGFGLRSRASLRMRQRSDATCCCQLCGVHSVEIGLSRTGLSCNDDLAIAAEPPGAAVCPCARAAASATIAATAQSFTKSRIPVSLAIVRIKFVSGEAETAAQIIGKERSISKRPGLHILCCGQHTLWLISNVPYASIAELRGPRLRPSFA